MSLENRHTPTCTYCHRIGYTAENPFVKRNNEALEKQDARFANNSVPTEAKRAGPSVQNNIMFMKEDEPVEEENTVAAFKRSADGDTRNNQQRMRNDTMPTIKRRLSQRLPCK